jgi:single-strand DNA-binding protein
MSTLANSCQFLGYLGADAERGFTRGGEHRTTFRIAINERKADGEESCFWVRVTTLGRLAEVCAERLGKGARVLVRGRLTPVSWTGNDGVPRFGLDLLAGEVTFLSPRASTAEGGEPQGADEEPF